MNWFMAHPFFAAFIGWLMASIISLAPTPKNVDALPYFVRWGWSVMQFIGASLDKAIQVNPKFQQFQQYEVKQPDSTTTVTKEVTLTPKV